VDAERQRGMGHASLSPSPLMVALVTSGRASGLSRWANPLAAASSGRYVEHGGRSGCLVTQVLGAVSPTAVDDIA